MINYALCEIKTRNQANIETFEYQSRIGDGADAM